MTLQTWKQSGRLFLWRYIENTKNFPGYHLAADDAGARSISQLIDSLLSSEPGFARKVLVSQPTDAELRVPGNRESGTTSPSKLIISRNPELSHWSLVEKGGDVVLNVGSDGLSDIQGAVMGTLAGKGDFALGNAKARDSLLWFWWRRAEIWGRRVRERSS